MKKILSVFLVVLALSCSCYADCVGDSEANAANTSVIVSNIDIKSVDKDGNTPLHLAVMAGKDIDVDLIKTLIHNGADLDAKNNAGYTPFECVLFDRVTYGSLAPKRTQYDIMMQFLWNGVHFDAETPRGKLITKRIYQIMLSDANPDVNNDPKVLYPAWLW